MIPTIISMQMNVEKHEHARVYKNTGQKVTIFKNGKPTETWHNVEIMYPHQPVEFVAVPVIEWDGKGPILWPTGGM